MEDGQGGCDDDDHREGGGGGGAIRQYSFFALAKPASSGQFSQFKGRKERRKTLEIIQVKLYATPPASTSLARSLATGPGT